MELTVVKVYSTVMARFICCPVSNQTIPWYFEHVVDLCFIFFNQITLKNMINIINIAVCYVTGVKRVYLKSSHHKTILFFYLFDYISMRI